MNVPDIIPGPGGHWYDPLTGKWHQLATIALRALALAVTVGVLTYIYARPTSAQQQMPVPTGWTCMRVPTDWTPPTGSTSVELGDGTTLIGWQGGYAIMKMP